MAKINRHAFPELNQILWDMHSDKIDEEIAFKMYEKRWAYVDKANLSDHEKQLINRLTENFGKGLFLAH